MSDLQPAAKGVLRCNGIGENPVYGPFDCQRCGACCSAFNIVPVDLSVDRVPFGLTLSCRGKLGFTKEEGEDPSNRMMDTRGGRCVALRGEIGKDVSCSTYKRRPKVCREFEAGSYGCLKAQDIMRKILWPEEERTS